MKRLFIILSIISSSICYGQFELGLKANAGMSLINSVESTGASMHYNSPAFSSQLGVYYAKKLGKRSILGAEIFYNRINGVENHTILSPVIGSPELVTSYEEVFHRLSLVSLPIYYGIQFSSFSVNLGIQPSFIISASTGGSSAAAYGRKFGSKAEIDHKKFALGPRAGIIWDNNGYRLSFEGNIYFGMSNILLDNSYYSAWNMKAQQATIGVRYRLQSGKK